MARASNERVPAGESLIRQLEQLFPYAAVCETDAYRYAHEMGRADEPPPEMALRIAVLLQARKDLVSASPTVREDAIQWVLSNRRSDSFGFVPICRLLELDCSRVRAQFLSDATKHNTGGHIHVHSLIKYETRSANHPARLVA